MDIGFLILKPTFFGKDGSVLILKEFYNNLTKLNPKESKKYLIPNLIPRDLTSEQEILIEQWKTQIPKEFQIPILDSFPYFEFIGSLIEAATIWFPPDSEAFLKMKNIAKVIEIL